MSDLNLPALDLPGVEPVTDNSTVSHGEVDRDVTPKSTVTSDPDQPLCIGGVPAEEPGEQDVNNLVVEMAAVMNRVAENEGDTFLRQVAHTMEMIGQSHSQGEYHGGSVCDECGMGDTPWPCWHWLQAVYTGVEWLYKRAGLRRPVRP